MFTTQLKELKMQLEELLKKGYIHPSVSPLSNIPNLLLDTYGNKSHCMWCCFDFLFCILGIRPHCTWELWFVWYIGRKPNVYVLCIWFHVLGVDPKAHNWWDICVDHELWGTWVFDVCVEWKALEHMSIWCLCWVRSSRAHEYFIFLLSKNL